MYIKFKQFDPKVVKHCFTTRRGGVSQGCYASLNMGFNRGDEHENVLQNYDLVCSRLGVNASKLAYTSQVHGKKIRVVTQEDFDGGYKLKPCDGITTDTPGITLVSFYADCTPLFFFDPVKRAIALAHAGWRGTLFEIGALTVKKMVSQFGCNPRDILAGIGPAIGKCCFETGADVAFGFYNAGKYNKFITPVNDKYMIDLKGINKEIIAAVIPPENIEVMDVCTKCNPNDYFSHRETGEDRGCMAAFMCIS